MIRPLVHIPFKFNAKDYAGLGRSIVRGSASALSRFGGGSVYGDGSANGYVHMEAAGMTVLSFTISMWFYPTADLRGSRYVLFENCQGDYDGSWLFTGNNSVVPELRTNDGSEYSSIDLVPNQWHHLVALHRRDNDDYLYQIYHNGLLDLDDPWTDSTYPEDPIVTLDYLSLLHKFHGGLGAGNAQGYVKDFRLYDYALSPAQVARLYNGLDDALSNS